MEGMYTHFAKADEIDKTFTEKQITDYLWMKEKLLEALDKVFENEDR